MNFSHQVSSDDKSLDFKLMLNKLLQYPHVDGEEAIEIARRVVSNSNDVTMPSDQLDRLSKKHETR